MESLHFFSLFILGLSYGMSACMFSCMPFLTPILFNNSSNGIQTMALFSLGRLFSYLLMSLLAFTLGSLIKIAFENNTITSTMLGTVTIIIGVSMIYQTLYGQKSCSHKKIKQSSVFLIGLLISLNPCIPVASLIVVSAAATSYTHALLLGLFFGVGAVLFPFVFYAFFLSTFIGGLLKGLKRFAKPLQVVASTFLIITGILIINQKITL